MKKVKTSVYFPESLKKALKKIKENDKKGRSLNQIIIDIMMADKEIQKAIQQF